MADLEDFFAKKGKKKKKKQPVAQTLEELESGHNKQEEEKAQPIVTLSVPEDSEWLESKTSTVEINPDDIQGVTLLKDEGDTSSSSENKTDQSCDIDNKQGEEETKIVTRNPVASPWQPVTTTPSSTQTSESSIKSDVTTVTSLAKDGKYVPPGLRHNTKRPHPSSGPPDISSTKAFPSLTAATKGEELKPSQPPVMKDYTELPLHNKFSALATD